MWISSRVPPNPYTIRNLVPPNSIPILVTKKKMRLGIYHDKNIMTQILFHVPHAFNLHQDITILIFFVKIVIGREIFYPVYNLCHIGRYTLSKGTIDSDIQFFLFIK